MKRWKLKLFASILTLTFAIPGSVYGAETYDDGYYDGYDYSYDDNYKDDWFHDSYNYGDTFNQPEQDYDYNWAENEYEWEEKDLSFDEMDKKSDDSSENK